MTRKAWRISLSIIVVGLFCLVGCAGPGPAQSLSQEPDVLSLAESLMDESDLLALARTRLCRRVRRSRRHPIRSTQRMPRPTTTG